MNWWTDFWDLVSDWFSGLTPDGQLAFAGVVLAAVAIVISLVATSVSKSSATSLALMGTALDLVDQMSKVVAGRVSNEEEFTWTSHSMRSLLDRFDALTEYKAKKYLRWTRAIYNSPDSLDKFKSEVASVDKQGFVFPRGDFVSFDEMLQAYVLVDWVADGSFLSQRVVHRKAVNLEKYSASTADLMSRKQVQFFTDPEIGLRLADSLSDKGRTQELREVLLGEISWLAVEVAKSKGHFRKVK